MATRFLILAVSGLLQLACSAGAGHTDAAVEAESGAAIPPGGTRVPDAAHSSRTALDWAGTYSGVLPCADCPGIRTSITLQNNGSFTRSQFYLDRSVAAISATGQFTWTAAGSQIVLSGPEGREQSYLVGEHQLIQLDQRGHRVTGSLAAQYVLDQHLRDSVIDDKTWVLVELRGRAIDASASRAAPFLKLVSSNETLSGNAGCNRFSGAYALKSGNRIDVSEHLAVTRMACADLSVEQEFLDVLGQVDSYAIAGGVLSLNRARMAPLARFRESAATP